MIITEATKVYLAEEQIKISGNNFSHTKNIVESGSYQSLKELMLILFYVFVLFDLFRAIVWYPNSMEKVISDEVVRFVRMANV